jgi:hypothetical protein
VPCHCCGCCVLALPLLSTAIRRQQHHAMMGRSLQLPPPCPLLWLIVVWLLSLPLGWASRRTTMMWHRGGLGGRLIVGVSTFPSLTDSPLIPPSPIIVWSWRDSVEEHVGVFAGLILPGGLVRPLIFGLLLYPACSVMVHEHFSAKKYAHGATVKPILAMSRHRP